MAESGDDVDIATMVAQSNIDDAQKALDENGEPMVVYHGVKTGNKFTIFESGQSGYNANTAPNSFYFTDDKIAVMDYVAGNDADNLIEVFLNIRNPYTHDYKGGHWTGVESKAVIHDILTGKTIEVPINGKDEHEVITELAKKYYEDYGGDYVITEEDFRNVEGLMEIERTYINPATDELTHAVDRSKYDGIVALNVIDSSKGVINDYIAFEPTQIKSATENVGTFDASNPDIRHRQGEGAYTDAEVSFANDLVSRAWGENLRSKKQQQSFANRIRKQMRQHAQSLAETLRITQKHENVQKIVLN